MVQCPELSSLTSEAQAWHQAGALRPWSSTCWAILEILDLLASITVWAKSRHWISRYLDLGFPSLQNFFFSFVLKSSFTCSQGAQCWGLTPGPSDQSSSYETTVLTPQLRVPCAEAWNSCFLKVKTCFRSTILSGQLWISCLEHIFRDTKLNQTLEGKFQFMN